VTLLSALCRAAHLGSLTLVVGAFAFLLLVARPAFRQTEDLDAELDALDRRLLRLAAWGLLAAGTSALAWLVVQAAVVTGAAPTLEAVRGVLTGTQFGRTWLLRVGLLALLAAFLVFRERERDGRDWTALRLQGLLLGAAGAAGLAWAGHAAATEDAWRLWHLGADALHLTATGVWLGGLLPLALLLGRVPAEADAAWRAVVGRAVRRFSTVGLASVGTLVLTGAVNVRVLVGGVAPLVGTDYGRLLLAKLALLLPLIALAAVNLLRLRPRLSAGRPGFGAALARLRRNVLAEAGLGAAIVALAATLGLTPPARHVQPTWPFPFRLSWEATRDAPGRDLWLVAGGLLALVGAAALAYAAWRQWRPRWALALGLAGGAYGLWAALSPLAIDAYPTTYLRPAVPYTALSVASGARLYDLHCALCHGAAGYGDGPAAASLPRRPADLTARHTADHTAGDLFWWLTHGIKGSPMPGFGDRLSEEERWDLVNYLRALAAAEEARLLGPVADPDPRLVAPDFTFGAGVGPSDTLKDHRGWAMVHLVLFRLPDSLPRLAQLEQAWTEIGRGGARVLAVPTRDADRIYRLLGARAAAFAIAVDGSPEIAATYGLFRRTLEGDALRPPPPHMEFLIDRQGYIRARWIPGEGLPGWEEIPRLLREVERLDREAPRAPAPDDHVH
jgi:putative copper export protein/mono/diheme cytochrome c family protein/peroxiredoxin